MWELFFFAEQQNEYIKEVSIKKSHFIVTKQLFQKGELGGLPFINVLYLKLLREGYESGGAKLCPSRQTFGNVGY